MFYVPPDVCGGSVFEICFGKHFFLSFLLLQSSRQGKESHSLCFNCHPDVLFLLMFWGSTSPCHWLVCILWLWYFFIMLTYLLFLFSYEKCFMLSLSDNDETLEGALVSHIPLKFLKIFHISEKKLTNFTKIQNAERFISIYPCHTRIPYSFNYLANISGSQWSSWCYWNVQLYCKISERFY